MFITPGARMRIRKYDPDFGDFLTGKKLTQVPDVRPHKSHVCQSPVQGLLRPAHNAFAFDINANEIFFGINFS